MFSEADPNTFCMYAERVKAQETELSEVDRMFQPGCGKRVKAQETEPRRINAKSFRFRRMYELSKGELPGGAKEGKSAEVHFRDFTKGRGYGIIYMFYHMFVSSEEI